MPVRVAQLPFSLTPDPARVITRLFCPGDLKRTRDILDRALAIPEPETEELLAELESTFGAKHASLVDVFAEHFEQVRAAVPIGSKLSEARRLFIGACFTMEYAIESVALFNPSIVPGFDSVQHGLPPGSVRFLMSLRATGEGQVSSIVFRTGVIDAEGAVQLDEPGPYSQTLKATLPDVFSKSSFMRDLAAIGLPEANFRQIIAQLGDRFTREDLAHAIDAVRQDRESSGFLEATSDSLISLTRVNYELNLTRLPVRSPAEIVIFPFSDIERHGIEDLRMVQFTEDDGSRIIYGTFTAFNGERVFPQLMEFRGDSTIEVSLITGECARNKGMALFPRRIHGNYAMISRIDNENLYYMESDDILFWYQARMIQAPKFPWQIMLIGNCGSPIETEAGWLLLTHGVGPMRQYCIGAMLLDKDDPARVIGQTREPLIMPTDHEHGGYVPNVVYSCGAMVHNRALIVPYAVSDLSTTMARIDLDELLQSLAEP
jgi:predicted GH43/DUF377 family glycosyl hydrolase